MCYYEDIIKSEQQLRGAVRLPDRNRADRQANPNFHLWNNNGTWWMHFTVVHVNRPISERIRLSLRTSNIEEARRRRDRILAVFSH